MQRTELLSAAGLEVVGYIDTDRPRAAGALGGLSDLVWVVERHSADTVLLSSLFADEELADILEVADLAGCTILATWQVYPIGGFGPVVTARGTVPFVQITRPSLRPIELVIKRIFDIALATAGLVLLSPLFVVLTLLVRLTSRGPAIFKQERVGFGGHHFSMFKFRSMVHDAEAMRASLSEQSLYKDDRLFKLEDDPRITPVGRFLRRTSMDELPQLWNVIRGQMSLVGPRPPLPREVAKYEAHHYMRFDMKPGVTGPWQVGGRNAIREFEEVIRLETEYMRTWSIWRDMEILFRTIPTVLRMTGA